MVNSCFGIKWLGYFRCRVSPGRGHETASKTVVERKRGREEKRKFFFLSMLMHLSGTAPMPGGQQGSTSGTMVADVFEIVHEIGDAA